MYDAIGEEKSFTPLKAIAKQLARSISTVAVHSFAILFKLTQAPVSSYIIALPPNENVGHAVWRNFVPKALASDLFKANPDPLVVGHGLKSIQDGLGRQKAGVSAQKIDITL